MRPQRSYTIWFSQRTGSTLFSAALEATGIAGRPREWLEIPAEQNLLEYYKLADHARLQQHLWELGSTQNGVFGVKFGMYEPHLTRTLDTFSRIPGCPPGKTARAQAWEHAFPHCRHIYMTRRNKVRLAVSWWKAIQTWEWHRRQGQEARQADLSDAYNFEAINHLYNECSMREAGLQEFYAEAGILPLTVVYEDFVQQYAGTIRLVLDYLGLDSRSVQIPDPPLQKLADEVSEQWVQRFREERQQGWQNRAW